MRRVTPWLIAIGGTAAVTLIGHELHPDPGVVGFAFLVVVLFASVRGGLLVGILTSIVATLCYNFFFFEPLYTFRLANPTNWITLAALLVTSVTVTRLVLAARVQAEQADTRRSELGTLYRLSVDLFTSTNREGALGEAVARALTLLGAREGGLVMFEGSPWHQRVIAWTGDKPDEIEDLVAGIGRHKEPLEIPSSLGRDVYVPLVIGGRTEGAFVARGTDASLHALVSASGLVGLAAEREKFIHENARMQAVRESELLKTSLLRAISHDLTTPLTAITIHTEAVRRRAEGDEELRASVNGIADETGRLKRRIDNLLSMARLESGKSRPRREPTPPADLFRAVRENLPLVPIGVYVAPDCPDANVDPSLAMEILVNLIENAHRVSPADATIELTARTHPDDSHRVRMEVLDRGPGVPAGATMSDVAQRGLGLEIARSLAAANDGAIALLQRDGGGTVARLDVPAALLPVAVERA
ncbi:MAG TPA: DUF4118 domain-containing protein [Thermoanaerobaculia bacterium]|nr:DUF4118 domain-containing protein [Thermoanaerobaculia bacterium]